MKYLRFRPAIVPGTDVVPGGADDIGQKLLQPIISAELFRDEVGWKSRKGGGGVSNLLKASKTGEYETTLFDIPVAL